MKECTRCKKNYPATKEYFFGNYKGKFKLQAICKICQNELSLEWRKKFPEKRKAQYNKYNKENKEKIRVKVALYRNNNLDKLKIARQRIRKEQKQKWNDILENKGMLACSRCGYDKCFNAIEFHHINPEKKEKLMAVLFKQKPTEDKIAELNKCIALCANCHRELHAN